MAAFVISAANSVFATGTAFSGDTAAADTLTVQADAYLNSSGSSADAVILARTGAWTVAINGSVLSSQSIGIVLAAGNAGYTGISVGEGGSVGGATAAIDVASRCAIVNRGVLSEFGGTGVDQAAILVREAGVHRVTNYGAIESSGTAFRDVNGVGDDSITNYGTITGAFVFGGGTNALTSSGTVTGAISFGAGADSVTNSGALTGAITFGNGAGALTNSGTVTGAIVFGAAADSVVNSGGLNGDIIFGNGAGALTNSGSISALTISFGTSRDVFTNAVAGTVEVGQLDFASGDNTLDNKGKIVQRGDLDITFGDGADTILNSGLIADNDTAGEDSTLRLGEGANAVTNESAGQIRGIYVEGGSGRDTILNRGVIDGVEISLGEGDDEVRTTGTFATDLGLDLGGGANLFNNSGRATTGISGGAGVDTVANSGTLTGHVSLGGGANIFTNTGTYTGYLTPGGDPGSTVRITNAGTFNGDAELAECQNLVSNRGLWTGSIFASGTSQGSLTLVNTGTIDGNVGMWNGVNRLSNSGVIDGNVSIRYGQDTFTNYIVTDGVKVSGTVTGTINLGVANDTFKGGDNAERVRDSGGVDTYLLGGGDDVLYADYDSAGSPDGIDTIDGGDGSDTYYAGEPTGRLIINLDTVAHRYGPGFAEPNGGVTRASQITIDGVLTETIVNVENVLGTDVSNIIFGNGAANMLDGGAGSDVLFGYGGDDTLRGGDGPDNDVLTGGAGRDTLYGGTGPDTFNFTAVTESVVGGQRDRIMDFNAAEGDQILLTAIDADASNGTATNEAFAFVGLDLAFAANTPGTVRVLTTATGYLVEGNTDADASAEFQIEIVNRAHDISWNASLFIL